MEKELLGGVSIVLVLLFIVWYLLIIVQGFFAYGTAYRKTKANGDNGLALYGWLFLYALAGVIPGLGIYFWIQSKKTGFR